MCPTDAVGHAGRACSGTAPGGSMRIDPVGLGDEMASTLEDFEAYWRLALERVGTQDRRDQRVPAPEEHA